MALLNDYNVATDYMTVRDVNPLNWIGDLLSYPKYDIAYTKSALEISVYEFNFWGKKVKLLELLKVEVIENCDVVSNCDFGYINVGFKYDRNGSFNESVNNYGVLMDTGENVIWHAENKLKEHRGGSEFIVDQNNEIAKMQKAIEVMEFFKSVESTKINLEKHNCANKDNEASFVFDSNGRYRWNSG